MLRLQDLRPSVLHTRGNAAAMAEEAELFFGRLDELLGESVASRDPLRPGFIRISDAPEPGVRPDDAEDAMIAYLDRQTEGEPISVRRLPERLVVRFDPWAQIGTVRSPRAVREVGECDRPSAPRRRIVSTQPGSVCGEQQPRARGIQIVRRRARRASELRTLAAI